MSKVDQGVGVACWGKVFQHVHVQGAAQEKEVGLLRGEGGNMSESFQPLKKPGAGNITSGETMPSACKRLASPGCFCRIRSCAHAVRAELDAKPVPTLRVPKTNAGAHAGQDCSQEEAGAEAGALATHCVLPGHKKRHKDWRRLFLIFGDDLLAVCHNDA